MRILQRHPKTGAAVMTGMTLVAGAAFIIMADFGAPAWAFVLLLAWLATLGLPSTIAVVVVASAWGGIPPASGLGGFIAVSALLAWVFQWAAVSTWNRGWLRTPTTP